MKKDERYVVIKLETRSKIKELSDFDKRTMKAYLETLIKHEYERLKVLNIQEMNNK